MLLTKLHCSCCKKVGGVLTTLLMYHVDFGHGASTVKVHSLICVECNSQISRGVCPKSEAAAYWQNELTDYGVKQTLFAGTTQIRLG